MNATESYEASGGRYPQGVLVYGGKTKRVYEVRGDPRLAILSSKDDITAGDGAKHDVMPGKARFANETTCNVFRLLEACDIPVAFKEYLNATAFVAHKCTMLPFEVVVRRAACGSYLKRNPHFAREQLFPRLVVEFFLKTSGRKWEERTLECDDPLLVHSEEARTISLYHPAKLFTPHAPFLVLPELDVFRHTRNRNVFAALERVARQAFLVLEKAWHVQNGTLLDFKVEFGFDVDGSIRLADVIDNDSWRVVSNGSHLDKQLYRDGGALNVVERAYARVAKVTQRFCVPAQRIFLWRETVDTSLAVFENTLEGLHDLITVVTCPVQRRPTAAVTTLQSLQHSDPDAVVVFCQDSVDGACSTILSLHSTVPVIAVCAAGEVRSNTLTISTTRKAPLMRVSSPEEAVAAALQILAVRNPKIYARQCFEMEKDAENAFRI